MIDATEPRQEWETPELTVLGDLEALTSAGAAGNEDGTGFVSI
jgi:hypothetical protein